MDTLPIKLKALRRKVQFELETNLVPFWLTHVKDTQGSGFVGHLSNDLVQSPAPKGLVFNARLLWTFSALYRFKPDLKYLQLAKECYGYLSRYFLDPDYGGAYWTLTSDGQPEDRRKKTYGQVFLIYAISEFYKCFRHDTLRQQCIDLFMQLERHVLDEKHLGYYEVCERDWTPASDQRLSEKDMNEKKSMNTHLHVLEALTNLYSIWDDALVKDRLTMLLEIFREKIIQPDTGHFGLFFDETWKMRSKGVSYGHEIEASWLICEAAKALNDVDMLTRYEYVAGTLAANVFRRGLDKSGGLNYEIDEDGKLNTDKHFWTQKEAVVGFMNAWEITCQEEYLDTAISIWDFSQQYLVDKKYGGCFWKVNAQGVPDYNQPKISAWKSPYHNVRGCIEMINRIDVLLSKQGSYAYG